MVAGWGTGKTMGAIFRSRMYSKGIPDNLGIIFRKTFRSLEDSTLKDYEKYTGIKVPSNREVVDKNGSVTMFRHLDEIESINQQNINLGWFYIEQGEELDSDKEFFMLFGRLRRSGEPTEEFKSMGLSQRSGWVIANAGDNWIKRLWKDGKIQASAEALGDKGKDFSELIEATTWDNEKNLPQDFLDSLRMLERTKPEIYKQFVMNDWSVGFKNKVFTVDVLNLMYGRHTMILASVNSGVSIDPSGDGADDNVFMAGSNGTVKEVFTKCSMSPSDRAHQAITMCRRVNGSFIIVDCDGVGIDTWKELDQIERTYAKGIEIIKFHGSAKSETEEIGRRVYENMRAEAAFITRKRAIDGKAGVDVRDMELVDDLKEEEFFTNKRGLIQLEPKKDIKERLGRSPGRGDAYKMLQYAFEQEIKPNTEAYSEEWETSTEYAMEESI